MSETCLYCGKAIHVGRAILRGVWVHRASSSMWCDAGGVTKAEPRVKPPGAIGSGRDVHGVPIPSAFGVVPLCVRLTAEDELRALWLAAVGGAGVEIRRNGRIVWGDDA